MKDFNIPNFFNAEFIDSLNEDNQDSDLLLSNVLNLSKESFKELLNKFKRCHTYLTDKDFLDLNTNIEAIIIQNNKRIKIDTEIDNVCLFNKKTRLNINSILTIIKAVSRKESDEMWLEMEKYALATQFKSISDDYKDLSFNVCTIYDRGHQYNIFAKICFRLEVFFNNRCYIFNASESSEFTLLEQLESNEDFIKLNKCILNEKLKNKLVVKKIKQKVSKI